MEGFSQASIAPSGRTAAPSATAAGGVSICFVLVLLFLAALYSQVAQQWPALEALRPAYLIGGMAIAVLLLERMLAHRSLELIWPDSYLLLAFVAVAALSCIGAVWQALALKNLGTVLKAAALYFLLLYTACTLRRLHQVLWTMLLGGLFPAIGTLANYAKGRLVQGRASWIGIFENPNDLAYSLVLLVPLAIYLASISGPAGKILACGAMVLLIAAICVSFSRGGLLALLASTAILGMRWRGLSARFLAFAIVAAAIFFMAYWWTRPQDLSGLGSDVSFQQRLGTMRAGLAMFADYPATGVGLGCSIVAWPLYAPPGQPTHTWLIVHNTFIQVLGETGLAGFFTFVGLVGLALYRARGIARRSAWLGLSLERLGVALEAALWGFIICGLSGGYVVTWFPYILPALVCCADRIETLADSETFA